MVCAVGCSVATDRGSFSQLMAMRLLSRLTRFVGRSSDVTDGDGLHARHGRRAVVFDFDGTIADSFEYVVGFLERQVRRGHPLTAQEKETLRGMTMHQMAVHLGSPTWRLPFLFITGRREMGRVMYDVPLFAGMGEATRQLYEEGYRLIIVSSNNARNIRKFLRHHHLHAYISDVYGGASFFGKRRAIRQALWRNRVGRHRSVYVGDETRDVLSANLAGVPVIAVGWGFDRPELLAENNPLAVVSTPVELVRVIHEEV